MMVGCIFYNIYQINLDSIVLKDEIIFFRYKTRKLSNHFQKAWKTKPQAP